MPVDATPDLRLATTPPAPSLENRAARFSTLDAWRGVACLLVLGFHATMDTVTEQHAGIAYRPLWFVKDWGFLGVQLFFVVSGYCIAAAAGGTKGPSSTDARAQFLRRRARRIYPTFWAAMAFAALVGLVALALERVGVASPVEVFRPFAAGWHWLTNLALVETTLATFHVDPNYAANGPLWTLCYEVQFYAFVALALVARSRRTVIVGVVALTVASVAIRAVEPPGRFGFLPDFWLEFLCGMWVWAKTTGAARPIPAAVVDLAMLAVVALDVLAFRVEGAGFPQDAKTPILCLAFAWLLVLTKPFDSTLSRWLPVRALAWVGVRSYSLYLIHLPVVALIAGVVVHERWADGPLVYAVVVVMSAAVIAVSALFHRFVERRFASARPPS